MIDGLNSLMAFSGICDAREVSARGFREVAAHRWPTKAQLEPNSLAAKTAHPPTVLPLPILIKCAYVLILLLFFFCLNSSFPCLGPIYYSEMSLEWDKFKTFHYGFWTQIVCLVSNPLGQVFRIFEAFFSNRENNPIRSDTVEEGAPLFRRQWYQGSTSVLFSHLTAFTEKQERVSFLTLGWKRTLNLQNQLLLYFKVWFGMFFADFQLQRTRSKETLVCTPAVKR